MNRMVQDFPALSSHGLRLPAGSPGEAGEAVAMLLPHLRAGGLVVYPTETVYGVGGLTTPSALEALARLKDRGDTSPFLLLIPGIEGAPELEWTPSAEALARAFWPGPVTLILADRKGSFPGRLRNGEGGVAVRVSPHPVVQALLETLQAPLTSTSANARGGTPPLSPDEVGPFPDPAPPILDAGALPPSSPSTLVDCSGSAPRILREGAVPASEIRAALRQVLASGAVHEEGPHG